MTEGADRERRTVGGLLLAHGVLLLGFDGMLALASLSTTAVTTAAATDAQGGWKFGLPALVGSVQLVGAVGVLACAGMELLAGWHTVTGRPVPLRGPALLGVVGSALVLPTAVFGCSLCGLLFWTFPLGFAASTAILAWRTPDPRDDPG